MGFHSSQAQQLLSPTSPANLDWGSLGLKPELCSRVRINLKK
jgi:hypothetical protein